MTSFFGLRLFMTTYFTYVHIVQIPSPITLSAGVVYFTDALRLKTTKSVTLLYMLLYNFFALFFQGTLRMYTKH